MTQVDVRTDPEQASSMAAALMAADVQHLDEDPPTPPEAPETTVTLPGGYVDLMAGTVATTAEVRELNGEDEEAISRSNGNPAKYFDTILSRGVVSVGELAATRSLLDSMLAGDRDALLIGIRRATFGDTVEYNAVCPSCKQEQVQEVSLSRDLEMDTLDDPIDDREWTMALASGKTVTVSLPNGTTSKALASVEDRNEGVLNTLLLSKTVTRINNLPVVTDDQVRKNLSIRDRREIIVDIAARNPGPKFGEVSRPCVSCGDSIPLPLSLVDLFLV